MFEGFVHELIESGSTLPAPPRAEAQHPALTAAFDALEARVPRASGLAAEIARATLSRIRSRDVDSFDLRELACDDYDRARQEFLASEPNTYRFPYD